MVPDLSQINGIDNFKLQEEPNRKLYLKDSHAFLVVHANTVEIRCDEQLASLLKEKYESVMTSRYFGRGGIEIVLAGQFAKSELADLIYHSYLLTT